MKAKKLTRAKDNLPTLFKNWPASKDNDIYLVILYWIAYDGIALKIGGEAANILANLALKGMLTNPETITRARRKFNEQGLFLGENHEDRASQQVDVKEWAKGA